MAHTPDPAPARTETGTKTGTDPSTETGTDLRETAAETGTETETENGAGADTGTAGPLGDRLTVEALLGEPVLRGRLLGGRAGVHHVVTWCLPLSEVEDAGHGEQQGRGDLRGVAVHAPAARLGSARHASAVVEELARRGAAALLVRPRSGSTVTAGGNGEGPDLAGAVRAADGAGLPLVGLASEADYRSIGRLVAVKTIAGSAHVLEYSVRVHRTLSEVFTAGTGMPALAHAMAGLAQARLLILDADGEVLASADHGEPADEDAGAPRWPAAQLHRNAREQGVRTSGSGGQHVEARDVAFHTPQGTPVHAVVAPFGVAGDVYGTVAVVEPVVPADPHDLAQHRVIVEQGAPLIASELLRQRSVTEAEERARDDFLDTLVHGRFTDVHELEARSRHYRFDMRARHAVFAASVPQPDGARAQSLLRVVGGLRGAAPARLTLAAYVGKLLVVVRQLAQPGSSKHFDAPAQQEEIKAFGEAVHRAVRDHLGSEVQVAHGRGAVGAAGVAESYREARIALELSRRVDVPIVCGYDRLRVFAAIEAAASGEQGRAFAEEILGPLRRADGQTGNLEQVVLAYIAESGNLNAAARRLQLHRNTMLYKLERASRALQMDMRSSETQFTVWLAHCIHTLNDSLRVLDVELAPPVPGE
ncbi:helix-turn-helix domain-containing protein [Streptomyces winkii]|uniref:helix-turn-helix domain-containing protein n=1 Tax=Streptomyces winkii TaxID=3051178 RepID=UPI0028D4D6AA|nr:helix-turn-helix domain-containing protein [Streptomyces sp. DSM 40971]